MLAYQYLQMLPELAQGEGNTFWVIPSEFTSALNGVSKAFSQSLPQSPAANVPAPDRIPSAVAEDVAQAADAVAEALTTAAQPELVPTPLTPVNGHNGSAAAHSDPA